VAADGIVRALRRQTAILAEHQIPVTASIGVALFDGLTNIEILAAADLAMYEAKEAGRNRFARYRPPTDASTRSSSRLAEAERIQRALTHDQLELYCQPILDLATNEVSQYELLVRLRTDDGDLLLPNAFLYVAERFGIILSVDSWVVQQAVALIAAQARVGRSLTLNVNISAKSIGNPQLVAVVDRALADARIDPARLGLRADRSGCDRQHRPHEEVHDGIEESRLPARVGRLWRWLRFLLLPEASPLRLFQDRRRLDSRLPRQQLPTSSLSKRSSGSPREWERTPWRSSSRIGT
jgi:predicted signal transduction protein with EAL and GGDEF domain